MKPLEWFYLITTIFGFVVNVLTFISFRMQSGPQQFDDDIKFWSAIASLLVLFYTVFAISAWAYFRWLPSYAAILNIHNKRFEEWKKDYDEWRAKLPPHVLEDHERKLAREGWWGETGVGYISVLGNKSKYLIPPPRPLEGFGKKARLLAIGLGILTYPFAAIWGVTFIPDFISTSGNCMFVLILLSPFVLSAFATFTAIITVNGIQDYVFK